MKFKSETTPSSQTVSRKPPRPNLLDKSSLTWLPGMLRSTLRPFPAKSRGVAHYTFCACFRVAPFLNTLLSNIFPQDRDRSQLLHAGSPQFLNARLLDRCFGSCRPAAPAQHMVQCRGVVLLLAALPSLVCGLLQRPNLWIIVADGESAVRPSVRTRYGQAVANAERA